MFLRKREKTFDLSGMNFVQIVFKYALCVCNWFYYRAVSHFLYISVTEGHLQFYLFMNKLFTLLLPSKEACYCKWEIQIKGKPTYYFSKTLLEHRYADIENDCQYLLDS